MKIEIFPLSPYFSKIKHFIGNENFQKKTLLHFNRIEWIFKFHFTTREKICKVEEKFFSANSKTSV